MDQKAIEKELDELREEHAAIITDFILKIKQYDRLINMMKGNQQ